MRPFRITTSDCRRFLLHATTVQAAATMAMELSGGLARFRHTTQELHTSGRMVVRDLLAGAWLVLEPA